MKTTSESFKSIRSKIQDTMKKKGITYEEILRSIKKSK